MTITDVRHPLASQNNLAELDRDADTLIAKAEAAYSAGNADEAMRLYTELDGIETRRGELEALETRRAAAARKSNERLPAATPMRHVEAQPAASERKSGLMLPGDSFVNLPEFKALIASGALANPTLRVPEFGAKLDYSLLSLKTLVVGNSVSGAGAHVINDFQAGYVAIPQRQRTFLDLVHRVRTNSDTIDWVKEITFTNSAAGVAEATATTGTSGTKPESAVNYERVTMPVETVAHWIPITTRALSDAPQMQDIINGRLLTGLELTLESLIISGDGTSPNISGLTDQGIQGQVWDTDALKSVMKATTKVEVTGLVMATDVVMHPTEWETVRLLRENAATATLGGYIMGPPSMVGPQTIFGLPVTKSLGIPDGTIIVGAFTPQTHALYDREQAFVRTGYIDAQFVRNMITMLAELRAAFAVFMPNAFCSITGAS